MNYFNLFLYTFPINSQIKLLSHCHNFYDTIFNVRLVIMYCSRQITEITLNNYCLCFNKCPNSCLKLQKSKIYSSLGNLAKQFGVCEYFNFYAVLPGAL